MHTFNRSRCFIFLCILSPVLGAFEEQSENINIIILRRLLVCLSGTAPLSLDEFSLHLIFSSFTKFCLRIGILFKLVQKEQVLHKDIETLMLICYHYFIF
jgi:hypothetical protein